MEEKTNIYILGLVGIIAVVALIVLVLGVRTTHEIPISKTDSSADSSGLAIAPLQGVSTTTIKANSCNADSLCETNTITSKDITINAYSESNGLHILARDKNGYLQNLIGVYLSQGSTVAGISANQITIGDGLINSTVKFINLRRVNAGSNNAYACLDSIGTLYRSDKPCN